MRDLSADFWRDDGDELSGGGVSHDANIELVVLDQDHPGFRDPLYRLRRNQIARAALDHRDDGRPLPEVPYTDEEHDVWRMVMDRLRPLHAARVVRDLDLMHHVVRLPADRIPQLREVSSHLREISGFTMRPVAGLVSLRTFLRRLGARQFLSTQYIRHASRPYYTPEPDVIHEIVGHALSLAHPGIAFVNELMGWAAEFADDAEIQRLGQVYWYTMEFGACLEHGQVKAVGAGLMSSIGELEDFDQRGLLDWDLDVIAETPFDPTEFQPAYFVAPSFDGMLADLAEWVTTGRWRRPAA